MPAQDNHRPAVPSHAELQALLSASCESAPLARPYQLEEAAFLLDAMKPCDLVYSLPTGGSKLHVSCWRAQRPHRPGLHR
jgi:hypothetical protein